MAYAEKTTVPVSKTRTQIEELLGKHGADSFAIMVQRDRAQVAFRLADRNILFRLEGLGDLSDQKLRSRWRALLLCIKAKLESTKSDIETIEQAFFAHIVTRSGETVYEVVQPRLEATCSGTPMPLLPPD